MEKQLGKIEKEIEKYRDELKEKEAIDNKKKEQKKRKEKKEKH